MYSTVKEGKFSSAHVSFVNLCYSHPHPPYCFLSRRNSPSVRATTAFAICRLRLDHIKREIRQFKRKDLWEGGVEED